MKKSKIIMVFILVAVLAVLIIVISNNKKDKTSEKTNDKVVKRTNTESSESSESASDQESPTGNKEESSASSSDEKKDDVIYAYKGTFEGKEITSKYKIVSDIDDFEKDTLEHVEIPKEVDEVEYKFEHLKTQDGRELIGNAIEFTDGSLTLRWKKESTNKYTDDCCYIVPAENKGIKVYSVDFIFMDAAKEIYLEDGIQTIGGIYSENAESVYIPSSVHGTFWADGIKGSNITKIVFGEKSETIFAIPIQSCPKLEEVTLPDTIKYFIGDMFSACPGLKRVKLPSKLEYIGKGSFFNCKALEELDIPDSVNYIEDSFRMCPNLTLIVGKDSYAQKYAEDNNIKYRIRE